MTGKPLARKRRNEANPNYGFRWCDREGFVGPSKGAPHIVHYMLCTVHGWMTVPEHYVCWLVAGGSSVLSAFRRAYFPKKRTGSNRQLKPKQKLWVEDLKKMHDDGVIDLGMSPWAVYGFDIGNEDAVYEPPRRDYSDVGFGQL